MAAVNAPPDPGILTRPTVHLEDTVAGQPPRSSGAECLLDAVKYGLIIDFDSPGGMTALNEIGKGKLASIPRTQIRHVFIEVRAQMGSVFHRLAETKGYVGQPLFIGNTALRVACISRGETHAVISLMRYRSADNKDAVS